MLNKLLPLIATLLLAVIAVFATQADASKGPIITHKVGLRYGSRSISFRTEYGPSFKRNSKCVWLITGLLRY